MDKFENSLADNWRTILAVGGTVAALLTGIYAVVSPLQAEIAKTNISLARLNSQMDENLRRFSEFQVRTERLLYTSDDADRDHQRIWDAIKRLDKENQLGLDQRR